MSCSQVISLELRVQETKVQTTNLYEKHLKLHQILVQVVTKFNKRIWRRIKLFIT